MPATCFAGLPRSAGVIAAALACELAGALRGGLRYARFPAFRSDLYALVGYKCMHRRAATRLAPPLAPLRARACLLASVLLDASTPRAQRSRKGLTIQAKAKKVVHCDGKNSSQSIRHQWLTSMSAGSETK